MDPLPPTQPPSGEAEAVAAVLRRAAGTRELWIPVTGGSMAPGVDAGSAVRVVPAERPRRGEVWAFCAEDGSVVVHRYRRSKAGALMFQGDANPYPDRLVAGSRLVGRVAAVRTGGGRQRRMGRLARIRARTRLDVAAVSRRIRPGPM